MHASIIIINTITHLIGTRQNISEADLSGVLPEEIETEVRQAAEISMGTEV